MAEVARPAVTASVGLPTLAAKVLPELIKIRRQKEKTKVENHLKNDFYPRMKKVISKQKYEGVKEELEKNKSIPYSTRKALELKENS